MQRPCSDPCSRGRQRTVTPNSLSLRSLVRLPDHLACTKPRPDTSSPDYGRNRHRDGEPRGCNRSDGSKTPPSRGTESSVTLRWRGLDSNFQYAEAVKLVVAAFSCADCLGRVGVLRFRPPRFYQ